MPDQEPNTDPQQQGGQAPAQPQGQPTWTDGEPFDPDRARRTIEHLRERERELTRSQITDEQRQALDAYNQLVEASKSEAERQQEALMAAQRAAERAAAEATRYKVAAKHRLGEDYFDLLGSGSEDEINARAEKLAALIQAQSAGQAPQPPANRPVEQLRPGATPTNQPSEDDLVFAKLFGNPPQ